MHRALSRFASVVAAAIAVAVVGVLTGCAGEPAPPGPSAAQLPGLVSSAEGIGPNGYSAFGVTLVRFVTVHEWPSVMTSCITAKGITGVDFARLPSGPYSYPADPQGGVALERALIACGLEYPVATLRASLHTPQQWNYEYSYLVNEFVPCVRGIGGVVANLPTRAAYLAAATQFAAEPSAYSYVTKRPSTVPRSLLTARCPATAPGL